MSVPKPSPDLFPKKTVEADKPKRNRKRTRRTHLTQNVGKVLFDQPKKEN